MRDRVKQMIEFHGDISGLMFKLNKMMNEFQPADDSEISVFTFGIDTFVL